MKKDPYLFNSKNSENLPHCIEFIIAYYVKISRFYHILTFLGNFSNDSKLSVLKQQLMNVQTKHGKGYT
jgi:hypothetical protein